MSAKTSQARRGFLTAPILATLRDDLPPWGVVSALAERSSVSTEARLSQGASSSSGSTGAGEGAVCIEFGAGIVRSGSLVLGGGTGAGRDGAAAAGRGA